MQAALLFIYFFLAVKEKPLKVSKVTLGYSFVLPLLLLDYSKLFGQLLLL